MRFIFIVLYVLISGCASIKSPSDADQINAKNDMRARQTIWGRDESLGI